jgi:hypothetical protein
MGFSVLKIAILGRVEVTRFTEVGKLPAGRPPVGGGVD